jgi:hypothetical protein
MSILHYLMLFVGNEDLHFLFGKNRLQQLGSLVGGRLKLTVLHTSSTNAHNLYITIYDLSISRTILCAK